MLTGLLILIAEDEPIIALDIAYAVEDAGGTVLGPAARVTEALALLADQDVAGAILDANLLDGDVAPLVDYLVQHGVPLIVQTGRNLPAALALRYPALVVQLKPVITARLVEDLGMMIAANH